MVLFPRCLFRCVDLEAILRRLVFVGCEDDRYFSVFFRFFFGWLDWNPELLGLSFMFGCK